MCHRAHRRGQSAPLHASPSPVNQHEQQLPLGSRVLGPVLYQMVDTSSQTPQQAYTGLGGFCAETISWGKFGMFWLQSQA